MSELLLALGTGSIAGLAHVYLGADHMAALMPLSHGRRWQATWLGVRWGLGHSIGVILVAIAFLVLRESLGMAIDFEVAGRWGERLVGVFLIGLGLYGIRSASRETVHVHEHEHEGEPHSHLHVHRTGHHDPVDTGHTHARDLLHGHAAIAAGTLHGLAGTSHLWGVMPSLALPWQGSLAYLAGFGGGSLIAMGLFAGVFGTVTAELGSRAPRFVTGSRLLAATACLLIGVGWIVLPLTGLELP